MRRTGGDIPVGRGPPTFFSTSLSPVCSNGWSHCHRQQCEWPLKTRHLVSHKHRRAHTESVWISSQHTLAHHVLVLYTDRTVNSLFILSLLDTTSRKWTFCVFPEVALEYFWFAFNIRRLSFSPSVSLKTAQHVTSHWMTGGPRLFKFLEANYLPWNFASLCSTI